MFETNISSLKFSPMKLYAKIIESFFRLALVSIWIVKEKYTVLHKVDQCKTSFTVMLAKVSNNLTCV